ncbi:MAG: FAD-binding oxidoreductase [Candidatus Eremiobacteraeota bacterium]|nr:FAD-binding oxidoreductase [Candidatus Eremiobacteraeota bacterium]
MIAPQSADEVSAAVKDACANGKRIAIEGGATLQIGRPANGCDVTLSLRRLNKLEAYEFSDLTVSVQAGMTVAAFGRILQEHQQFVPLDAPLAKKATVGGTLAGGWLGPRRHYYGRSRDFVIGCKVVLADGTPANAGGMVVKNVTGYDMSKLYIGSLGTLAIFVQCNFKTLPSPKAKRVLLCRLPENTRSRAIAQASGLHIAPSVAVAVNGFARVIDGEDGADGRLFLMFEGTSTVIERATRDVRSALGKAGVPETVIVDRGVSETFGRLLDAYTRSIGERSVTYRSTGLADRVVARSAEMLQLGREHHLHPEMITDLMNGDVTLRVTDRDLHKFSSRIQHFDEAIHAAFPNAAIIAASDLLRGRLNVWGELPMAIEKMRRLKMQFDPEGTLNPGRFIGDPGL